jgi:hypothetical protein
MGLISKIGSAQHLLIFSFEKWKESVETTANDDVQVLRRRRRSGVLTGEIRFHASLHRCSSTMITQGALQHTPKPNTNALLPPQLRSVDYDPLVESLHDLLSVVVVSQTALKEFEERVVNLRQHHDHRGGQLRDFLTAFRLVNRHCFAQA